MAGQIPQARAEIMPPAIEEERDRVGGATAQPGAHALDGRPAALEQNAAAACRTSSSRSRVARRAASGRD